LLGGGGVDGCIHEAAGPQLKEECKLLNGCSPGETKITSGYNLRAKFVLHTVGPIGEKKDILSKCYKSYLSLVLEHQIKSVTSSIT